MGHRGERHVDYETITFEVSDKVGTVTLNRPERLNAFNDRMMAEFAHLWDSTREDDDVHVIVLRANGDRAFCTGVDVGEGISFSDNPYAAEDPGLKLSPKANRFWKPVIAAVHGMAAGGAFYWLNESDLILATQDATFFDPHVTYGMISALEPIGLARRINLGDALRWALMGIDERMSAERALQIGLVTELCKDREALWERADEIASRIAAKPTLAVQGTVKAIWESLDHGRKAALDQGLNYPMLGNDVATKQVDFGAIDTKAWTLR